MNNNINKIYLIDLNYTYLKKFNHAFNIEMF